MVSCVAVSLCKQHITAVWLEHLLRGGAGAARGASLVRGLRGLSAGEGDGGSQLLVDLAQLIPPRHLAHGHGRPVADGVHGELARHVGGHLLLAGQHRDLGAVEAGLHLVIVLPLTSTCPQLAGLRWTRGNTSQIWGKP